MISFKPTKNRVLVEPLIGQNSSIGGIFIPEAHRDTMPSEAVVVALGNTITSEVKIGDRVVINRFGGTDVKIENKMFKLLDPTELLAIIE